MRTHRKPGGRGRAFLVWLGVGFLIATTVVLIGWRVHGGRWVRVETPSMGTTAPVGSLLWVAPVRYQDLRRGDLITFTPPGSSGTMYTHLIRAVNPDGTLSTQGKITAPDPWRLPRANIVGKVVMRWRYVGWLVLAAPVLLFGAVAVTTTASRVRDRDLRLPVLVVGGSLVLVAALVIYRPLTRADQISFVPVGHGARATYVATGILPVRVSAAGGTAIVLRDGQVGSVRSSRPAAGGGHRRYSVTVSPSLSLIWWMALVAACFTPAVARMVGGLRARGARRANPR